MCFQKKKKMTKNKCPRLKAKQIKDKKRRFSRNWPFSIFKPKNIFGFSLTFISPKTFQVHITQIQPKCWTLSGGGGLHFVFLKFFWTFLGDFCLLVKIFL
jgi:hypothetical protein